MRKLTPTLLLLLIGLLALAACGGDDSSGTAAVQRIQVTMHDIYFGQENDNIDDPPVWTVSEGNDVNLTAMNEGALEHNWALVEDGATLPEQITDLAEIEGDLIYDVGLVASGETGTGRFTAPAAGNYLVICTVAGHYPQMQGRLLVTE